MKYYVLFVIAFVTCVGINGRSSAKKRPNIRLAATASDSNVYFASNFHTAVLKPDTTNMVCSPLSAQLTLGMARLGAQGDTASQISNALFLKSQNEEFTPEVFRVIMRSIKHHDKKNSTTLKLINWMFVNKQFNLKRNFLRSVRKASFAPPKKVDFTDTNTVTKINQDVSQFTRNKIQNLVQEGDVNADTVSIMVNALYFKGHWQQAFEKIDSHPFFPVEGQPPVNTEFLNTKGQYRLKKFEEYKASAIQIPYDVPTLSLVLILPDYSHSINELETSLKDFSNMSQLLSGITAAPLVDDVEVYVPKFKMETSLELNEPLKEMGMPDMFDEAKADFHGMVSTGRRMWVSQVAQKTFIELSELGTEAAAGTYMQIQSRMFTDTPKFNANRPFMFVLMMYIAPNRPIILFSGRYVTPP